ncbi:MAG: M24 family metallopeptidase [Candidatus Thorarchaeota archaeon]
MKTSLEKKVFSKRIANCSKAMNEEGQDVLLLTKPSNMYYFTGDGRLCAFVMISSDQQVAIGVPQTDVEDVTDLAHFDHILSFEDEVGMIHSIAKFFRQFGISKGVVGLEHTFLTSSMMKMLTHPHAKPEAVTVADCTDILSKLRTVKDSIEIELMKEAGRIADLGMEAAMTSIKVGMTESQIAGEGEYAMRQAGAEGFWRSYVASGSRTRIAHGIPTSRKVQKGDIIMIDLHPFVNNYSSDICRLACIGEPAKDQIKAYDVYLEALQKTTAKSVAGIDMVELEKTLHGVIQTAGYGENIFGPPIHGIGINFEEAPLPPGHAFFHGEKAPPPLEENTTIAIGNCGIYSKHWGIRIEDTVVIGKRSPLVLTNYSRDLKL